MAIDLVCLYLLLNWRGSQGQDLGSLAEGASVGTQRGIVTRIKEVSHDQVVKVLLICVVGLV
jgi:preprotein translocase subunit YajC